MVFLQRGVSMQIEWTMPLTQQGQESHKIIDSALEFIQTLDVDGKERRINYEKDSIFIPVYSISDNSL